MSTSSNSSSFLPSKMKLFTISLLVIANSVVGSSFAFAASSAPSLVKSNANCAASNTCMSATATQAAVGTATSVDYDSLPSYYKLKTPTESSGSTYDGTQDPKARGLTPRGPSIPYSAKVKNLVETLRAPNLTPLDKYNILHTIQDADERLYYKAIVQHTHELMPLVYTPTVGSACLKWGEIYRQMPRGIYLSQNDKGSVEEVLKNWPFGDKVKVIVVTDGERILGLGDLGTNGMGIPIGKLALYTALGGIPPEACLPIHIDVGTNNVELRNSPMYMGLKQPRIRQNEGYDDLIAEFFTAAKKLYGKNVLVQFEDFGNMNAFRLLEEYQDKACTFNDDIQGTASVVLAGVLTSLKLTPSIKSLADHTFLFNGAGEAGVGIANLISLAIQKETGCTEEESHKNIWLVDSQGLVTAERDMKKLAHHKVPYAHKSPSATVPDSLLAATKAIKPTALIGVSAQPQTFTEEILKLVTQYTPNPLVFALSNPTSKAECTAEQAYTHTDGKCIFASGSPFDPVTLKDGREFTPGQGNNAYIFPGVGLGAVVAGSTKVTDEDMYIAAKTLSSLVSEERLSKGSTYPKLEDAREVSAKIAAAIAENAYKTGVATAPKPDDIYKKVKESMWSP